MEINTENILRNAFERAALVAAMIDFQDCFYSATTESAFNNGARLSANLHEAGVQTIWCITPNVRDYPAPLPPSGTMKDFPLQKDDRMTHIPPHEDDLVFTKGIKQTDMLINRDALEFFQNISSPVIIAAGVHGLYCARDSIASMLNRLPDAHVIAAYDAINLDGLTPDRYKEYVKEKVEQDDGRLHLCATDKILEYIPQIN